MGTIDLSMSRSLEDENVKALTYRVRGISNGLDKMEQRTFC